MSQYDIMELLKSNPGKRFTSTMIAEELNLAKSTATTNCKRLRKQAGSDIQYDGNNGCRGKPGYEYWVEV